MARKPTLTDDETPTLTDAELSEMRPARDVLTPAEFSTVSSVRRARRGRPTAASPKVPVTIRLDARIVDAFKVEGRGWQTRMNEALADFLAHGVARSRRAAKRRDTRATTGTSDGGFKTATGARSQKP